MYPFLIFAQGLHNVRPDLKIFEHKDGVLLKGVDALLALSDADGEFFPLNDGQKGMSYNARSVVTAVNIAYHAGGRDPRLLGIAQEQGQVLLDDSGISVALAIRDGAAVPYNKKSVNLSDGPGGKQGGVAVLRHGNEDLTLVFKYAAQGLSHGHYDKLSYSLHEKGDEVIQDYGLVRFVNIEQKGGGNYLKENTSWAKQTIAHSTITQNETSHFQGKYEIGSQHHSALLFYDDSDPDVQVVSAIETNAYPGTAMRRTMAIIKCDDLERPFVLDIFKVDSAGDNRYDLPFYYMGHVLSANFDYETPASLSALGKQNGFQHLYVEGVGSPGDDMTRFSWMGNSKFYTVTSATQASDELLFTRIGANDPDFNLRRDPGFMIRRQDVGNTLFVSTIETHGSYSPVSELAVNSNSSIAALNILLDDNDYTAVSIEDVFGGTSVFIVSNSDTGTATDHEVEIDGAVYRWSGPYYYKD